MKNIKIFLALILSAIFTILTFSGCTAENEEQAKLREKFSSLETKAEKINFISDEMLKKFSEGEREIVFTFDCADLVFDAYERVFYENPQLFWLNASSSYVEDTDGVNVKVTFKPYIKEKNRDIKKMRKEFDEAAEKALKKINRDGTDYEKALSIHDFIVENTSYDDEVAKQNTKSQYYAENISVESMRSNNAYGCLVNKNAVCMGYSFAFDYLADLVGLESRSVAGYGVNDEEIPHRWNCVKIDGEYYYLDVTWDDPVVEKGEKEEKCYDYFLINESELLLTHKLDEDQQIPSCTSDKYDYYKVNGLYMDNYDIKSFSEIFEKHNDKNQLSVKFSSLEECQRAYKMLIKEEYEFWYILKYNNMDVKEVLTSFSDSGKILNIYY